MLVAWKREGRRKGRHGEGVQRGSRPAHARSEIFPTKRRPAARPAHVEKRRHGGRIEKRAQTAAACPPPPLLDRPTARRPSPLLRPRRPEQDDAPRRRRRASLGPRTLLLSFLSGGGFVSGGGRRGGVTAGVEMVEEGPGPADLRELVRLPDVLVVCSSRGWTDAKHMLYLQLLEETFVSQLHDGERSFKGLFNVSPKYCRVLKSSKQIVEYDNPDQGCRGLVDTDRVDSCMKVELIDSPSCCGNQQDVKVHSIDDNASTTEPVIETISQRRATRSGQSAKCYVGKHRHSPSRSAEGSDQNFDEETKGIGESRRGSKKRLKSYDVTKDDQVVPSVKAEDQKAERLIASEKHKDRYNGFSKVDAGSLDAETRSATCKNDGLKG